MRFGDSPRQAATGRAAKFLQLFQQLAAGYPQAVHTGAGRRVQPSCQAIFFRKFLAEVAAYDALRRSLNQQAFATSGEFLRAATMPDSLKFG
jgi:hypothetical protein